jgi:hypothetical protein
MRTLYVTAALVVAAGVAGTVWAVGELRNGVSELPQHWWSSAPVALVALGLTLMLALAVAPHHAQTRR